MGEMNTGYKRLMCEFACIRENACDVCIPQSAQNMTEAVRQLGRKQSCKALPVRCASMHLFSSDCNPVLLSIFVTLQYVE